jgi:uncharacterized protein
MADILEKPKSQSAIVAELKAHASEIRKQGVTSLALFGSRARGDEHVDSDLDVLIDYDRGHHFSVFDLAGVQSFLEELTGLRVHLATRDGFRAHRLRRVLRDAVVVL